ncbi:MAG: alpha/beta fold hydrolase [Bacteroidetes bacterium]|nr:alpha/beta fold hydrolase [Bacteroidota bacterium]
MYPLLLLHGALGNADQFQPLNGLITDRQVLTMTFPGHSGKAHHGALNFEIFVDAIQSYLDKRDIEVCDVFGFSMGGYAALKSAIRFPDRFRKIATLGTKFNWTPESAAKEVAMLNPDKILEKVPAFAETLEERHGENWKQLMQQTAGMMTALGNGQAMKESDLSEVYNRVVIGRGSEDKMVSEEESRWAAQNLWDGSYVELPGVEHPFEKMNFDVLAEFILTNLNR